MPERLPYADAISILNAAGRSFEYPVTDGLSLQSEHERFLAKSISGRPVIVFDHPRRAKPFYMRVHDDGRTVAALDVLVPGIGEIIGGSQREERLSVLLENMRSRGLREEDYWWYLDLRSFWPAPHAGFGQGSLSKKR